MKIITTCCHARTNGTILEVATPTKHIPYVLSISEFADSSLLLDSTAMTNNINSNNNSDNCGETSALIKNGAASATVTVTNNLIAVSSSQTKTTSSNDDRHYGEDESASTTANVKVNQRRHKAIRMMSSPSCSFDIHDHPSAAMLLMTTTNDETSKTDKTNSKQDKEENEEPEAAAVVETKVNNKPSRLDRLLFRNGAMMRSKSLEAIDRTREELLINELQFPVTQLHQPPTPTYNRLRSLKESIHCRLARSRSASGRREYGELTLFNKLRKIRQFKESLKNKSKDTADGDEVNTDDDYEEYNEEQEGEHDEANQSFEMSSLLCDQANMCGKLDLQGSSKYWIGKDYCNFIYKDVKEVHSPFKDSIDRTHVPRMPWHDVAGCVSGPAARDIARHFIQRWNYVKMKKVHNKKIYPLLVPKSYQAPYLCSPGLIAKCTSGCRMQVLRSVSAWSSGQSRTESSIHSAMCHMITNAQHYVYIENQFFVSLMDDSSVQNGIARCLFDRIVLANKNKTPFKCYILVPLIPGYEGEYGRSSGVLLHAITHYNNASINGLIKRLADVGVEALNYICFFSLRTWSELNSRLVTELIYVHSKLMIVDDRACLIGSANINDRSLLGTRDSEVAVLIEDTQMCTGMFNKQPVQVGRFCSTLRQRLFRELLGEFHHQHYHHNQHGSTQSPQQHSQPPPPPLSQPTTITTQTSTSSSSSLNESVSVSPTHSWTGGKNCRNRLGSLLLQRDENSLPTSVAVPKTIELNKNTETVATNAQVNFFQNGSSHSSTTSSSATTTASCTITTATSAAAATTPIDLTDPCSDDFYKKVLLKYASQNTRIYDLVFNVIPSNYVNNFQQLKEYQKTISLSRRDPQEARNELAKVKGYIVLYPNRFLCYEDLKPPLGTKEKLIPNIVWT